MSGTSTDRRRCSRFPSKEGTIVFFGKKIGTIMNISMKGLSFRYMSPAMEECARFPEEDQEGTIDIVYGKDDFHLNKIPVRVIREDDCGQTTLCDKPVQSKRCSVMFGDLSPDQLFLLKRFLLLNTFRVM